MTKPIKVTRKTARLLCVLLEVHEGRETIGPLFHMSSAAMARQARLGIGSFYLLMVRLEGAGWVESEKEKVPEGVNRPPRAFYHLTEDGVRWAEQALKEHDNRKPWYKRLVKWIEDATDDMDGED